MAGSSAIDSSAAGDTVSVAELDLPPKLAEMTAVPLTTPFATPEVLSTVATVGLADDQAEVVVTSREAPSANVAVATNCCMPPLATVAVAGLTVSVVSVVELKPKIGSRP